jgi:DNA-binding NtrC family response regulator
MDMLTLWAEGAQVPDLAAELHHTNVRSSALIDHCESPDTHTAISTDTDEADVDLQSEPAFAHEVEEIICLAQGMVQLPPEGLALKDQLVQIERSLIEQALARTSGNVSQSARLLRVQRTTLIEKINKYDLRVAE